MLQTLSKWLSQENPIDQAKSEAIIALLTLLYQADGKVRYQEQDLFEKLLEDLPWQKPVQSKAAFHHQMIAQSRTALAEDQLNDYLADIVPILNSDPQVLAMLRDLAMADGDLDVREAEILGLVIKNIT